METLSSLRQTMIAQGAVRLYAKLLAPNDNSKNQIYVGGDFSVLHLLPHGRVEADTRYIAGSIRNRAKADVEFYWLSGNMKIRAPSAQLVLYPRYPEVRLSGLLRSCSQAPSEIIKSRAKGRILFLGVTHCGKVLGYASNAYAGLTNEVMAFRKYRREGVFREISLARNTLDDDGSVLLERLKQIHELGWISSVKLNGEGVAQPYSALNGGGYTLEAQLGINPNGFAEPDFMGWEIKQYGVVDFVNYRPKSPITLMTPEPTGGIYRSEGVHHFITRFGYSDRRGQADRINFGGISSCTRTFHENTGLRLIMHGFDRKEGRMTDISGSIQLISRKGEVAAEWAFSNLMDHWNRKHNKAVYIPSKFKNPPPEYAFGSEVLICRQTEFSLFLNSLESGDVYYDPGIKMETGTGHSLRIKRRSQFRIAHRNLAKLYLHSKRQDLLS